MEVKHVHACQNILGEGPMWHVTDQALYWVDIEGKKIQRFFPESGKYEAFDVPLRVSLIAFRKQGGMICGTDDGFYFWDIKNQKMEPIANPEKGKQGARFNDGKVDRSGRLWAGTMTPTGATSALYRVDADLSVSKMIDGTTISNGIGWSPDNKTMYFVDSNRYIIHAFDFDIQKGMIEKQRTFVHLDADFGVPDGLTVDSEGYIWCAIYDGWKVVRFSPHGEIAGIIEMPVSRPSSCMFGGKDLDTLYITSIAEGLTAQQKSREPLAGDLFMIKTQVKGIPEPYFAG